MGRRDGFMGGGWTGERAHKQDDQQRGGQWWEGDINGLLHSNVKSSHLTSSPPLPNFHIRVSTAPASAHIPYPIHTVPCLPPPTPPRCTHLSISLRISSCAMLLRRE